MEQFKVIYRMVWRANLYIDEDGEDWNNLYPWNAPSTGDVTGAYEMSEDYSVCFKKILSDSSDLTDDTEPLVFYGNNEWNTPNENYTGMPGGQTFILNKYNDLFGLGVPNGVAYTYPENTTTKNARDTPFEFNDKLEHQKQLMANEYNIRGKRFTKPKTEWPSGKSTISDFTLEEYNTYIDESYVETDEVKYPKGTLTSLESWNKITAPSNSWSKYSKNDTTIEGTDYISYIPNLGLITMSNYWGLPGVEELRNIAITDGNLNSEWKDKAAGTDCIGFAQNAANYGKYKWNVTKEGLSGSYRLYPRTESDADLKNQNVYYSRLVVGMSNITILEQIFIGESID